MGRRSVPSGKSKFAGSLLLGVAVSALAVGALGGAGSANASCVSFSGLNSGSGCKTANFGDTAIGIGNTGAVEASGGFNTAIAVGTGTQATAINGQFNTAVAIGNAGYNNVYGPDTAAAAYANGTGNTAFAMGTGSVAGANGVLSTATVIGSGSTAITGGEGVTSHGSLNRALVLGDNSFALAAGGDSTKGLSGIGNNSAMAVGNGSVASVNWASTGTKRNTVAMALGSGKTVNN
jgi:hypothetical protein